MQVVSGPTTSLTAQGLEHLDLSRVACLGDALRDACVPFSSNVALIECDREREQKRLHYGELRDEARRIGALLQERGVEPGDRVAILMQNQSAWLASALGALWAGAILVPIDYKLEPEGQRGVLEHAEPRVLIVDYPIWRKLDSDVPALVASAPDTLEGAHSLDAVAHLPLRYVSRSREDIATIVYSSGTSGSAKGCMLTHHNYLEQAQILGRLFPMHETDRFFSILPTNHAIDFMCGFVIPLLFGASVVHQRTLRPQFLAWTMQQYGVTHMALVPALLRGLRERVEESLNALPSWQRSLIDGLIRANETLTERKPRHGLSSRLLEPLHRRFGGRLRLVVCGGAIVDRSDAEFFYRIGIPVAIGYGLTEACTVVSVNDLAPFRGDTVGKPVPGVDLELRDVAEDGVGEVWVRGATVMRGYYREPELTQEALVDGWLRTGDLGRIDASGHLRLLGRSSNMIVTDGGKNVYPEDVETAFAQLEGCEEYCVVARNFVWRRRELSGEELLMVLRTQPEADATEVLRRLATLNRRLPVHKRVGAYLLWDEAFPRTASLKIKRAELAKDIRERCEPEVARPVDGAEQVIP